MDNSGVPSFYLADPELVASAESLVWQMSLLVSHEIKLETATKQHQQQQPTTLLWCAGWVRGEAVKQ